MGEWSLRLGATVLLPEADQAFITRPVPDLELYGDDLEVVPGVRLIRTGGHFPGSSVVHWEAGADGRGALLTGDTVAVARDRAYVSVMWSYPNFIPVDDQTLSEIEAALEGVRYDRIYGGWWPSIVEKDAERAVAESFARYRLSITQLARLDPNGGA